VIKLTFVIYRRPELSVEEFHRYWQEQHGPLIQSYKDTLRIRRYVQTHTLRPGPRRPGGMGEPHDGVAELWWESLADFDAAVTSEEARLAARVIVEDESKFIDFTRSSIALAEEIVFVE
jgi:uncharacterized protein (TIGR02118 family)